MIIPPENLGGVMRGAELVVLAVAEDSFVDRRGSELVTVTRFVVLETVSGYVAPGDTIQVVVPGGEAEDGTILVIEGAPRFGLGVTYLLPLAAANDGRWQPSLLSYGILERSERMTGSLLRPLAEAGALHAWQHPDGTEVEGVGVYRERDLLDHLAAVTAGTRAWDRLAVEARPDELGPSLDQAPPSGCAFLTAGNGKPMRWKTFDSGNTVSIAANNGGDPTIVPGGGIDELKLAISDWNAIPATSIKLRYQGEKSYSLSCGSGFDTPGSGSSIVVFSDPCNDLPNLNNCSGTVAYGGAWASGTHTWDGVSYYSITSLYVVVNNGISCLSSATIRSVLTHELGHGLGFGHVADPHAVMYPYCGNRINETDIGCAQYLYSAIGTKAPAAPASISASDGAFPDRVSVSWAPATGAASYTLTRKSVTTSEVVELGPVTATSWDDTTAAAGERYIYTVRAANAFGASSPSKGDEGHLAAPPATNPFLAGSLGAAFTPPPPVPR